MQMKGVILRDTSIAVRGYFLGFRVKAKIETCYENKNYVYIINGLPWVPDVMKQLHKARETLIPVH
jgi:hypothetical protein